MKWQGGPEQFRTSPCAGAIRAHETSRRDALDVSPGTLLQLAPNVRTRFDAAGHVLVDAPDGTIVDIGPRGYSILSLFATLSLEASDRLDDPEMVAATHRPNRMKHPDGAAAAVEVHPDRMI